MNKLTDKTLETQIKYSLFIMDNYKVLTKLCLIEGKKPTAHNIMEEAINLLIKQN